MMLRPDRNITSVYLHRAPVDMRRQMDGLSALVEGVMKQNPLSGSMFVFINKQRDKLKILMWERNGFVVWYKRLEQEKFRWPLRSNEDVVILSGEQLNWLLDGYDVWRMKPHKTLYYAHVG
jgi:transposase